MTFDWSEFATAPAPRIRSSSAVVDGAIAVGALAGGVIGEFIGVREAILTAAALMMCVLVVAAGSCLNGADPPAADADASGDGGPGWPEDAAATER